MGDQSRRGFLALAGAGAAAVGLSAVVPATEVLGVPGAEAASAAASGPLVAYVKDSRTGEVSVMVGEREVIVHDRELVARLARAAS
jgi:hypothetical protein